ncbi:retrovirus-related pol polyprotein from transposon TNT 1-94 [Tanacetum coccineum]
MTSLADKAIPFGDDMRFHLCWKEYILENGPTHLASSNWENGVLNVTRPKRYSELSPTEAIQTDCDIKATNIILQGLPPEVYALGRQTSFSTGTSRTYTPGASESNSGKQRTITCYNCKGEGHMSKQCTEPKRKRDDSWFKEKVLLVEAQAHGQILNEEYLNFFADPRIQKNSVNSSETTLSITPTNVEVPKELPKEIFQRENFVSNQSVPSFDQLFELNKLKAQSQEKDIVIKKLKERIKSLSGNMYKDKIKQDLEEIETINIELDHRVTKLIVKNEHLKQTYKKLHDSIKPARIRSKEQCDDLINQVNIKKLKGKALVDNDVSNHPSDPEMHQVNMEPITPKLLNKRSAHSAYIKHTQEEDAVLRDLVDHIKAHYPLDSALESALCQTSSLTTFLLPSRTDWDILFQSLFDELFNPPLSVDFPAPEVIAPIDEVVAPEPAISTS